MNIKQHIEEKVDQFIGQGFSSPEAVKNWLRTALTSTITKMLEADIERLEKTKNDPCNKPGCLQAYCINRRVRRETLEAELTLKQQQLDELTKDLCVFQLLDFL